MKAFFFVPHKSFDKIQEEYGIKISEKELERIAELSAELYTKKEANAFKEFIGYIAELGYNKGLKGKQLGYFIYDVMRTSLFYLKALEFAAKEIEKEEGCDKK